VKAEKIRLSCERWDGRNLQELPPGEVHRVAVAGGPVLDAVENPTHGVFTNCERVLLLASSRVGS